MQKKNKVFFPALAALVGGAVSFPLALLAQWNPLDPKLMSSGLPSNSIHNIIFTIFIWLLGIFGFIGIIGFVISGIMYLTAAGNDTQITKAKDAMKWSIIGVVVGLVGLIIIQAVDAALRGLRFF